MRTIVTRRMRLVPVTEANAAVLWEILQQPDLRDFQDLPNLNRAQFLRTVGARPKRFRPGAVGRFEWLMQFVEGADGPLGWVSLRIGDNDRSSAEIGYSVVGRFRRQGLASEAVAALVNEGFERGNLSRIRAYCVPQNAASRAVLARNGFEEDGTLPRGATVRGRPVDVMAHVLQRQDWEAPLSPNRRATLS
jgi:ribosomal-protein-alanine N-acetyltransferase